MSSGQATVSFVRDIPVRHEVDVLVAGGGPAGFAAALVAARQGAKVRLIEAHSCLGGLGTAGMVPVFMPFTDGVNFLAGGVGRELLTELQRRGGTYPPDGVGIRAEALKRTYEDLLSAAGAAFCYHCHLIDAVVRDGVVAEAVCAAKSGLMAIRAKVFVDATGDGDLAAFAGAPYEKGDDSGRTMPGTLCSLWSNIDWAAVQAGGLGMSAARIEEAIRDGVFALEDRHLPGMVRVGETLGGGNIGHAFDLDGTDEESLTRAYVGTRKSLLEFERYYKQYLKGFERMELAATGSLMGVRESRRILGGYVLNLEDFEARAVFEDEIGRFSYPVDIHIARPDKESYEQFRKQYGTLRLGRGESYGIPYRVLTPRGLKNVLVAGRCISSDRYVQSSIRVMPGCYITGQAAGLAAVMMIEIGADSRAIDVKDLQKRLRRLGAFLPNLRD